MDYEKLHKDTINRLQQMVSCGKITVEVARGICADFIPENENERIRKEIIEFFKDAQQSLELQERDNNQWQIGQFKIFIAWLEKQGQNFTKKDVDDAYLKGICVAKHELEKQGEKGTNGNEREIPFSAWSEEDEKILNSLIISLARIGASTRTDSTSINYTFSKEIDWLKSLRHQKRWKPSDGQMIALDEANTIMYGGENYLLTSLYNDLKKLREE